MHQTHDKHFPYNNKTKKIMQYFHNLSWKFHKNWRIKVKNVTYFRDKRTHTRSFQYIKIRYTFFVVRYMVILYHPFWYDIGKFLKCLIFSYFAFMFYMCSTWHFYPTISIWDQMFMYNCLPPSISPQNEIFVSKIIICWSYEKHFQHFDFAHFYNFRFICLNYMFEYEDFFILEWNGQRQTILLFFF